MYCYDEEEDLFEFDGDFTQYLLDIGVEAEHIVAMKRKVLQAGRGVYQEYPPSDSDERGYIALVPLDKVIGTSRCTVGWSVYENVRRMYRSVREPGRFENCFLFLQTMNLEELRRSYEQLVNPVKMEYYVDDDEYYLITDGNHRTLTAMLVGAKFIKAKVTNAYCNHERKKKYEYAKEFTKKYKIQRILRNGLYFDIEFRDTKGVFEIRGYEGIKSDESMYEFADRLARTIDEEVAVAKKIEKMPSVVRKMILHFIENPRTSQYVEKKYLSEDEQVFWYHRDPIWLYDL